MNSIRAVIDWLVDGARSATLSEDMIAELCRRMVACDLPLWRVAVFVRTLHPDIAGRRFVCVPSRECRHQKSRLTYLNQMNSGQVPSQQSMILASHSAAASRMAIALTIFRFAAIFVPRELPTT